MELPPSLSTELAQRRGGSPFRILVVDDSPAIRRRLVERLEEVDGIEVVGEAGDGRQAFESIKSVLPHLLTLDIRMPGGNGLGLLRELREMESAPLVAVVTNHTSSGYRSRCMQWGALAVFDKSSQIDDLILLVEALQRQSAPTEFNA